MNILGQLTVLPRLPERIERLAELAHNLYWTWNQGARVLFRRLDPELWEASNHNPIILLRDVKQEQLEEAANDPEYAARFDAVMAEFDSYLKSDDTWFASRYGSAGKHRYAYFCAEYGWHESIPLYSGGLGVLAGDHTKAASDLGVPLVGIGLRYPEGYFHQKVAEDGQQEAYYVRYSEDELPFAIVRHGDGSEVRAAVGLQGREVQLRAWRVAVGRGSIFLLDSDLPENDPADRELLSRLYGGDQRTRIAQEIVLGIGGVRMLRAIGIHPTTWHINEGHSAFMVLERCRELVEQGLPFETAREVVTATTVFTVHTPVPAGNDVFPLDLVMSFFSGYWGSLGLNQQRFLELGRHDQEWGQAFSMPALGLRFSSARNGVAQLHGETSRRIWNDLWPGVPTDEVPIEHVTNGVHAPTWIADQVRDWLDGLLPADWPARIDEAEMWQAVRDADPAELWQVRRQLKAQSVRFLRRRVLRQLRRYGASAGRLHELGKLFDPETLTIGFARRFATYKRATLIFRDLTRLEAILTNPEKPVQLVFSGKAHPADVPGQQLIETIHNLARDPRFAGRIVFIEDYDMAVGRSLTRGVDVWLNNPRRPLEASGTSGQKAAMNGILNLSILDGWWPEGFDGDNGWAITTGSEANPAGDDGSAVEALDAADADALYDLLEREVVPLYYERDEHGTPRRWLQRAKASIASVTPRFNARHMLKTYVSNCYAPASERHALMTRRRFERARRLAKWRGHVTDHWAGLYFSARPLLEDLYVMGEEVVVEAVLNPGEIDPKCLRVEVVYSAESDELNRGLHVVAMQHVETYADGGRLYRASFKPELSGCLSYGARAYPDHADLVSPFDLNLIRWA